MFTVHVNEIRTLRTGDITAIVNYIMMLEPSAKIQITRGNRVVIWHHEINRYQTENLPGLLTAKLRQV